ncbi:MAG: GNAT family protein [Pseudomonadota bacterium]
MAFLKTLSGGLADDMALKGDGVVLRYPTMEDFEAWARLRGESRDFLVPWEPAWTRDELTRTAYRRRLRRYARDIRDNEAHPFFIFKEQGGALVGGVTLSNIRRGVARACALGYWVGASHRRQGYVSSAVATLLPFVFGTLQLHRLEAACLPENAASEGLLRKLGFTQEGYAREYLKINGVWRDHLLFAMVKGDLKG